MRGSVCIVGCNWEERDRKLEDVEMSIAKLKFAAR